MPPTLVPLQAFSCLPQAIVWSAQSSPRTDPEPAAKDISDIARPGLRLVASGARSFESQERTEAWTR
mgnify:CR=1 FL=1